MNNKKIPNEVEPFKSLKDISRIKQFLYGKKDKRDYMLFVVGINIGLRASDLLMLKIGDVYEYEQIKSSIVINEKKTGKKRVFELNQSCKDAISECFKGLDDIDKEEYLFRSRKGKNQPIGVRFLHRLIKTLTRDELKIKGNYGTHSLRKTFGYHVYKNNIAKNPMILPTLSKIFNHSSQAITLRYIGITKKVIEDVYHGLNL